MHFMGHFMHAGGVPEGAWVFNIYAAFTFPKNIHFMHCAYTMRQHCCGLKENVVISKQLKGCCLSAEGKPPFLKVAE